MTTLRMTADVKDDRRVVLTLPPEVPTGMADFVVTVEPQQTEHPPRRGVPAAAVLVSGQVQPLLPMMKLSNSGFTSIARKSTDEAVSARHQVLLDLLLKRVAWAADAAAIWEAHHRIQIWVYAAAFSLPTIFYMIRKQAGLSAAQTVSASLFGHPRHCFHGSGYVTGGTYRQSPKGLGASQMTTDLKPMSEVNHEAIRLLSEQIGVVDTFRFVNQFTTGHGNYTEERGALLGHLTLEEIVAAIEKKRTSQEG